MAKKFCKFCGQNTDTPCVDETDLSIYSRTVERCSDANFARIAEEFYESHEEAFPTLSDVGSAPVAGGDRG